MQPNVLLVVLDSVRARNTSLHGHANETTPFLDSFADEATTYTQARAPSTWSLPSHVSMFTGLHPPEHGLDSRDRQLVPGQTVWERLADDHGYETGVFSSNPFLTAVPVGLERAFDTAVGRVDLPFTEAMDPREFVREHGPGQFGRYVRAALSSEYPVRSLLNGAYEKLDRDAPELLPDAVQPDASGHQFVEAFLDWEAEAGDSWAACLNLMDAHHPYEPASEFDQWGGDRLRKLQRDIDSYIWEFNGGQRPWWQRRALEGLYDGCIRQLDDALEELLTTLEARGVLSDTLVVVTGDHGEGFGEPSTLRPGARAVGHGNGGAHEVLLHVPLVVHHPGRDGGRTVDSVCSLTQFPDLVEATLRGADGDPLADDTGPVLAAGSGLNERMRRNAERYCEDLSPYEAETRVVYEDGDDDTVHKWATWRSSTVETVVRDATTSYPISEEGTERVTAAFDGLADAGVTTETESVDDDVQQRLEDLGYA